VESALSWNTSGVHTGRGAHSDRGGTDLFSAVSHTSQLTTNAGTSIVTHQKVFLIQIAQIRDGVAIRTKVDQLMRVLENVINEFAGIEHLTEVEVRALGDKKLAVSDHRRGRYVGKQRSLSANVKTNLNALVRLAQIWYPEMRRRCALDIRPAPLG
jgi:low affinity Fe/Cu permease